MSVLTLRLLRLFLLLALARLFVRDPIQRLVRNSDIHAFRLESGQKDVQSSRKHWLEFLIAWHTDNAGVLFDLCCSLSRDRHERDDEKSLIGMDTARTHVCKFILVVNALAIFLACKFFNGQRLPLLVVSNYNPWLHQ